MDEFEEGFAECVSCEQVGFSIPEFVVSMSGIGGVFFGADEVVCGYEGHSAVEFGMLGCGSLCFAECVPFAGCVDPGAGEFTDDDGQLRGLEFVADVIDEVDEVGFVFGDGFLWIDAVIPSVVPDESRENGFGVCEFGQVCGELFGLEDAVELLDHELIVFAGLAACGWWSEIDGEAFAAPCGFDEEYGVFEGISENAAAFKFGAEVMGIAIDGEAHGEWACEQRAGFALVPAPDVVAAVPRVIGHPPVLGEFCGFRIFKEPEEGSAALVVVASVEV